MKHTVAFAQNEEKKTKPVKFAFCLTIALK